jgi:hypothetical protein
MQIVEGLEMGLSDVILSDFVMDSKPDCRCICGLKPHVVPARSATFRLAG